MRRSNSFSESVSCGTNERGAPQGRARGSPRVLRMPNRAQRGSRGTTGPQRAALNRGARGRGTSNQTHVVQTRRPAPQAPRLREHIKTNSERKIRQHVTKSCDAGMPPEHLAKMMAKRKRIIQEINDTETTYVLSLKELRFSIMIPLEEKYEAGDDSFISRKSYPFIFQNISKILDCNSKIVNALNRRLTNARFNSDADPVCDIFLRALEDPVTQLQKTYQSYVNGYDEASKQLKIEMKNGDTRDWIQSQLAGKKLTTISSYLITPIQRLPRYILLLSDLKNNTPENHKDYRFICMALDQILNLTSQIDNGKALYESMLAKESLYKQFSSADHAVAAELLGAEEFLHGHGQMSVFLPEKNKADTYYVILCTTFVLITKRRYKKDFSCALSFVAKIEVLSSSINYLEPGEPIKKNANSLGTILIRSLERIETPPFIEHLEYQFSPTGKEPDEGWKYWRSTFEIGWRGTANLASLARRAWVTKSHLSRVILSNEDWEYLSIGATTRSLKPQEKLLSQGDPVTSFYYLKRGQLAVSKSLDGEDHVIGTVSQGNFVGDIGFISRNEGRPCDASAALSASVPCTIIEIPHQTLDVSLKKKPSVAWRFYFLMSVEVSYRIVKLDAFRASGKGSFTQLNETSQNTEKLSAVLPIIRSDSNFTDKLKATLLPASSKTTDPVLEEFKCHFGFSLDQKMLCGTLFITQSGFRVYRKVFGKKTQAFVPFGSVLALCPSKDAEYQLSVVHTVSDDKKSISNGFICIKFKNEVYERATMALTNGLQGKALTASPSMEDLSKSQGEMESDSIFNEETTVNKGTYVITQGKLTNAVYQLVSGTCKVLINDRCVTNITDGHIFGELGFLLCTVPSASIVVTSNTAILAQCTWDDLSQLCLQQPSQGACFYRNLSRTLVAQFLESERKLVANCSQ